jgi:UTP--glucose-1-phosphate uridylyltransferase/phosphoglucomutase
MNSFSTSDDTRAFLAKGHADLLAEPHIELMQNMSPKVDAATLAPATHAADPDLEWCPPGHGDIYASLLGGGMLDALLAEGVRYVFVSNSDNLGATLDLQLLAFFASSNAPFMMEVCERTAADKKGGHLARRKADGKFMLRESAMCPDADKAAFEDITLHRYFNTNNLWLNLPALKAALDASGGVMALPLIVNKKTVDPRDSASAPVFQLETAMGSAIECFDGAAAVVVPRTRFAPVKTTSDLFVLRSDAYAITPAATVEATVARVPLVKLDDAHYKLVDKLERLVKAEPSLKACSSLTVKGPVRFGEGVVIKCVFLGGGSGRKGEPWCFFGCCCCVRIHINYSQTINNLSLLFPLLHRGDVTLECAGPEPVTVANATFDGGKHAVAPAPEPAVPAGAPAFA